MHPVAWFLAKGSKTYVLVSFYKSIQYKAEATVKVKGILIGINTLAVKGTAHLATALEVYRIQRNCAAEGQGNAGGVRIVLACAGNDRYLALYFQRAAGFGSAHVIGAGLRIVDGNNHAWELTTLRGSIYRNGTIGRNGRTGAYSYGEGMGIAVDSYGHLAITFALAFATTTAVRVETAGNHKTQYQGQQCRSKEFLHHQCKKLLVSYSVRAKVGNAPKWAGFTE